MWRKLVGEGPYLLSRNSRTGCMLIPNCAAAPRLPALSLSNAIAAAH